MVECLEGKKNGLLESPTGTGKTMSLISSSIGWLFEQQQNRDSQFKFNKIFVASRTHT